MSKMLNSQIDKEKILSFVLSLQNNDGGFRRSSYLGISELEYTYRAIHIIKTLNARI